MDLDTTREGSAMSPQPPFRYSSHAAFTITLRRAYVLSFIFVVDFVFVVVGICLLGWSPETAFELWLECRKLWANIGCVCVCARFTFLWNLLVCLLLILFFFAKSVMEMFDTKKLLVFRCCWRQRIEGVLWIMKQFICAFWVTCFMSCHMQIFINTSVSLAYANPAYPVNMVYKHQWQILHTCSPVRSWDIQYMVLYCMYLVQNGLIYSI